MARILTCGWESGAVSEGWNNTVNAPTAITANFTASTSTVRSGGFSLQEATLASTPLRPTFFWPFVQGTDYYVRVYVWYTAAPSITSSLVTTDTIGGVNMTTGGAVTLAQGVGTTSPVMVTSAWNLIQWHYRASAGATSQQDLYLNGTLVETITTGAAASAPTQLEIGMVTANRGQTVIYDDLALNDSTGSNETSYPPDAYVKLLLPISDNAVGTGWTNDLAASTGLWDALNNTPPLGIADTTAGSGLHQIRNATANANVNYDANTQSYKTAGLPSNARITMVQPVVNTSAPSGTSAKAGNVLVVSNPATASTALWQLGSSGGFWSGTIAGTFSAGWGKWSWGTPVYYPAITPATSPVVRIQQVTSSTRIAMVDFLAIYVEYSTRGSDAVVSQAMNRAATR